MVTVLLAVTLLKERLGKLQMIGIALSLTAVYLLTVRQERGLLAPWLPLAILPVVLWGVAGFLQKISTSDVSVRTSAAWFLSAFVLVGLIVLVMQPLPPGIPGHLWVTTAVLGFALAFGNYAITVAYASKGKASVITPLVGMYPLVSIPAALVFFGETVGGRESLGALLALTSIVALTRERRSDVLRPGSGDTTCDGTDAAKSQAAPPSVVNHAGMSSGRLREDPPSYHLAHS